MGTLNVFYIRVCRVSFDTTASVTTLGWMDFLLYDNTTKKKEAYRFSNGNIRASEMDNYEAWEFAKKNKDPWDRFVLKRHIRLEDFHGSSQLYSQFDSKKRSFGEGSRVHGIRLLMWLDEGPDVTLFGSLRYPEPVPPFIESGKVRLLKGS
jgi:hypothetical protein